MRLQHWIFLSALMIATPAMAGNKAEFLTSEATSAMNLPFSDAVKVGDTLFLSGQLGVSPDDFKLVGGGIEPETHQMFANIKRILERNHSGLELVFKCTVMMADIAEWPAFNKIYVTYFPADKPARSAFGANGLALGARVEMECWATTQAEMP